MSDAQRPPHPSDERRRLTKKAPPAALQINNPTTTAVNDHAAQQKQHNLRRAPSAPIRNRYSAQASSPAHNRSPTIDGGRAADQNTRAYTTNSQPRYSVTEKSSTDLLGQRFDSAAVINSFNAVPYSADPLPVIHHDHQPSLLQNVPTGQQRQPAPSRPAPVLPENKALGNVLAQANPGVRLSQSLAATGRRMEDIPQQRSGMSALKSPTQRYSDEGKDTKALKKKSGFSSFFNLSSPRRPAISAPENPVHVTHVGYDQETGEFTVRMHFPVLSVWQAWQARVEFEVSTWQERNTGL
jgi:p21-activated kinase 1